MARVYQERAELRPSRVALAGSKLYLPAEGLGGAEAGGLDLVADGTGNAVGRLHIASVVVLVQRQVGEHLRFPPFGFGEKMGNGHVAGRTLVLNLRARFGVIDGLAPHTALPVRIARRVGHYAGAPFKADGDVFAALGLQLVVTGNAPIGGAELISVALA